MRLAIGVGNPWRERCETLPPRHFAGHADTNLPGLRRKDQLRLTGADQVDIDLGQEFRVEQRAVLGAMGIVDRIARAEIVEPVRDTGMLAPGKQQGVDQPHDR